MNAEQRDRQRGQPNHGQISRQRGKAWLFDLTGNLGQPFEPSTLTCMSQRPGSGARTAPLGRACWSRPRPWLDNEAELIEFAHVNSHPVPLSLVLPSSYLNQDADVHRAWRKGVGAVKTVIR